MKILNAYSPSVKYPHPVKGKSMTEQHHEKSCNINNILAKYQKTGLIDHINKHQGSYGDVTGHDFESAQNLVAEQKTIFHELPASVREYFDHDVANYLDMMKTDDGVEELRNLLNPISYGDIEDPEKEPPEDTQEDSKEGDSNEKAVT